MFKQPWCCKLQLLSGINDYVLLLHTYIKYIKVANDIWAAIIEPGMFFWTYLWLGAWLVRRVWRPNKKHTFRVIKHTFYRYTTSSAITQTSEKGWSKAKHGSIICLTPYMNKAYWQFQPLPAGRWQNVIGCGFNLRHDSSNASSVGFLKPFCTNRNFWP